MGWSTINLTGHDENTLGSKKGSLDLKIECDLSMVCFYSPLKSPGNIFDEGQNDRYIFSINLKYNLYLYKFPISLSAF